MKIKLFVLLLIGVACLGADGASGRRRSFYQTLPDVVGQRTEDTPSNFETDSKADDTAVRKSTAEFAKCANARDAKAAAALWTEGGEFTDDDGTSVRGRTNIEKMYSESFGATPKGKFEMVIDSVRLLGKNLAASEGALSFTPADGSPATITKISAMHVREGDAWLVASAREWLPERTETAKVSDLEFLIGDWEAKRDGRDIHISYSWGDGNTFLKSHFVVKEKGKETASGTEIIMTDPASGELRAWLFDQSGTIGQSVWAKEGSHWVIDANGTLAQGMAMSATNILIPLGKDAFTWQSVDRSVGGQSLPNHSPLKVTRVKK